MSQKNILFTGATSYLGINFIEKYSKSYKNIFALIRPTSDIGRLKQINNIVFINKSELQNITIDDVIHMATCYGRKQENTKEIYDINYHLPLEIIELLHKKIQYWINIDTSLPRDVNDYSKSKAAFTDELRLNTTIKVINLKLQQIYGPHDGKLINFLVDQLISNVPSVVMTKGLQQRDFIYIDDAVQAIQKSIDSFQKLSSEKSFIEVEIGTGETHSVYEIANLLKAMTGNKITEFQWGAKQERNNEPQVLKADLSILKNLGWSPQFDLEHGLDLTLKKMAFINGNKQNEI